MRKNLLFLFVLGFIAFALVSRASAELANSPWPKFRHDAQNTGRSPYFGAQDNKLQWYYQTGGAIFHSSPILAVDGTIYVGSYDNHFYAVYENGSLRWSYETGAPVVSSPAIGVDGTIYIGSWDRNIYALNPDGSFKWSYAAELGITTPTIGSDGTIYFSSYDNKLYAVKDEGNHATLKWSYPTEAPPAYPAISSDGTIYFGSDNKLYALNSDGTLKWSYNLDSEIISAPAIGSDGTIYFGTYQPITWLSAAFYALEDKGDHAELKWSFPIEGGLSASPAIGPNGTIYFGSRDTLYALSPDSSEKWRYVTLGDGISSSPAVGADGTIYFGVYGHYPDWGANALYALNENGEVKWIYNVGYRVDSSPAIGPNGTIYFGAWDGRLYAVGSPVVQPQACAEGGEDTLIVTGVVAVVVILLVSLAFWFKRR